MRLIFIAIQGLAGALGGAHSVAPSAPEPQGPVIAATRAQEDPQLIELRRVASLEELKGRIPESLIQAVADELAANPRARLGLSARAVEPFKVDGEMEPIELIYSFGSYKTLSGQHLALEAAKLRAAAELLDERWERLTPSVGYRQIFKEFNRKAELPAAASISSWAAPDDKNWAFTLCVCPIEEIKVEPEEVAAAWKRYFMRLSEEGREAVRSSKWDLARQYLAEHKKHQPLAPTDLVTEIWANYFDGKAKGDSASASAFLATAESARLETSVLLSFLEFLIVADLDTFALSTLKILERG